MVAAALVLIATRHDPLLSPDSITYLSAAQHVRSGHGLTDFTGKPLAVFGPVYPLLLSPGGRSLAWATVVGMVSIAAGSALMGLLLHRRVRPIVALAGALAFGASQGFVHMASVVWSEAPYAAIALATLVVLKRNETNADFDATAVSAVFAVPENGITYAVDGDGKSAKVIQSQAVMRAPYDPNSEEAKSIAESVQSGASQDVLALYLAGLQDRLGVTINETLWRQISGTQTQ